MKTNHLIEYSKIKITTNNDFDFDFNIDISIKEPKQEPEKIIKITDLNNTKSKSKSLF